MTKQISLVLSGGKGLVFTRACCYIGLYISGFSDQVFNLRGIGRITTFSLFALELVTKNNIKFYPFIFGLVKHLKNFGKIMGLLIFLYSIYFHCLLGQLSNYIEKVILILGLSLCKCLVVIWPG